MKVIIFDASTIISLAMNGLLPELRLLKENFDGKFIITKDVRGEIVDRPLTIRRFQYQAMQIQDLIEEGVLESPEVLDIDIQTLKERTNELLDRANSMYIGRGKPVKIIHLGEASALALGRILEKENIPYVIAIDERTTRMLGEKPDNLKKLLERKLHISIRLEKRDFDFFRGFGFLRSTELIYIAWKKGLIKLRDKKVLEALLYALKFKGCSISDQEIKEIIKIR